MQLAKSDSFTELIGSLNLLLPPGGVAVFATNSTAASDVSVGIRWAELF